MLNKGWIEIKMKNLIIIFLLLIGFTNLFPGDQIGHLAGKITDELAQKPIENMTIAIGDNVYS